MVMNIGDFKVFWTIEGKKEGYGDNSFIGIGKDGNIYYSSVPVINGEFSRKACWDVDKLPVELNVNELMEYPENDCTEGPLYTFYEVKSYQVEKQREKKGLFRKKVETYNVEENRAEKLWSVKGKANQLMKEVEKIVETDEAAAHAYRSFIPLDVNYHSGRLFPYAYFEHSMYKLIEHIGEQIKTLDVDYMYNYSICAEESETKDCYNVYLRTTSGDERKGIIDKKLLCKVDSINEAAIVCNYGLQILRLFYPSHNTFIYGLYNEKGLRLMKQKFIGGNIIVEAKSK